MTLNRGAQRAIIATFFSLVAAVYLFAWSLPAIALDHEAAAYLVTARSIATGHGYTIESLPDPIPQTNFPPLFPAVLALFTLASQQSLWLKLLPLASAIGWFLLTRRLLLKMGASINGAFLLLGLTAASPTVVFLSTSLLPETLFALLATACLLALLDERALLAGLFAGLATLTMSGGVPLIVACILTLVARRRLRGAAIFAGGAMLLCAPWFGWSLAQLTHNPTTNLLAPNVFTGLPANEKLVVLSRNLLAVVGGPFALLTGLSHDVWAIVGTIAVLVWCFYVRRQLLPDLFVALYSLALLFWIAPPGRGLVPILPLFLWIVWRVFRLMQSREALAALVIILAAFPLWADGLRILPAQSARSFSSDGPPPDNWNQMQRLFGFLRDTTPPASVVLANMDGEIFLQTGRKALRGFTPNGFNLYYAPGQSAVTPDQLLNAIARAKVDYVILTPDQGLPESAAFHNSVEALERGGVVDPVLVPGATGPDYRVLKVTNSGY
jgi:hypothetical protein